jgi:predicted SprT family Zn-dependent metalloprotease
MIHRKRTHKDVTDPKILEIWNDVIEEAKRLYPRYFEVCTPELYQDSSYSHLGRCSTSYKNPCEKNVDKIQHARCIITISSNLKQDYEQIRKTLCHELGHFVSPRENHRYLWKARTNKIGAKWGYEAERLTNNETFSEAAKQAKAKLSNVYKYRLFCPKCGVEWKYKTKCSAVKYPYSYRCRKCYVKLESEEIK